MKSNNMIKLLPLLVAPFVIGSCSPPTEYHTVKVYEYTPKKSAPKKAVSDEPRDFRPVGLGN